MSEEKTVYEQLCDLQEELEQYYELENDEHGECVTMLCGMVRCTNYYMSAGFEKALLKELQMQLKNYKQSAEIVEEEVEVKRTSRSLNWR
jgi:hypothetical protein